jgi:hypothetical protein
MSRTRPRKGSLIAVKAMMGDRFLHPCWGAEDLPSSPEVSLADSLHPRLPSGSPPGYNQEHGWRACKTTLICPSCVASCFSLAERRQRSRVSVDQPLAARLTRFAPNGAAYGLVVLRWHERSARRSEASYENSIPQPKMVRFVPDTVVLVASLADASRCSHGDLRQRLRHVDDQWQPLHPER